MAAKPCDGGQLLKADAKTIKRLETLVAKHNDLTYDRVSPAVTDGWHHPEPLQRGPILRPDARGPRQRAHNRRVNALLRDMLVAQTTR